MAQEAKHTQTDGRHTPGPWHADEYGVITGGEYFCTSIATTGRNFYADKSTYGVAWYNLPEIAKMRQEHEANARLIASAPDLLAKRDALKQQNVGLTKALRAIDGQLKRMQRFANLMNHPEVKILLGYPEHERSNPVIINLKSAFGDFENALPGSRNIVREALAKIDAQHATNTERGM